MALAANTGLTAAQTEAVQVVVDALRDKRQTLLGYVDTERSRLTSRDAEERSAALNELCAVVLRSLLSPAPPASADDVSTAVARGQIDQLLPFLLSKVEDCGHLCDMLINTLHQMLKMYDGVVHVLPNECVDQAVAVLFDGGGAQSYGKRDRRLLFSCLDHLVATHAPVLRSAVGAQRVLLAFIRSAQGEREPCVLAQVFALHQRMTCNFSMGVLSEDMFELVACYFPIDYEPNEEETEPISREQLRYGCESALLAHDAFAPFCMQLVTEKLLETENDGTTPGDDGSALVRRQLEICEFFIRCCAKFCNTTNAALHEHVEDLMTAVRLLFMNPIQQRDTTLLLNTTTTVKQMLHALASMLEHNTAKLNDPTRFIRLMAESSLENVEPFVLQAEMGTAGCAFCLLRCMALAHPVTRALCVPRALYWLNMLIGGQTLRSGENRAEIATEALMLVPEWLRFCFIADGVGLFVSGGGDGTDRSRAVLSAEARKELISATVVPLLEAVRQLKGICELDVLLAVECEAHSILLLFLDTVPPHQHGGIRSSDGTKGEEGICRQLNDKEEEEGIGGQLRTLCSGMALRILPLLTTTDSEDDNDAAHLRNIVQQTDTAKWGRLSAVLKQFIALSTHLTMGGDQMDERGQTRSVRLADPKQWPRLLELLPALLQPLPDELEQRRRMMHQKSLLADQNFASAIGSMLLSAFLEPSIDECTCTAVREMARRLTASAGSTARDCFTFFVVEQLMNFVVDVVQNVHEHAVDQQFNLKRLDRLAELLQDVGALAVDNISAVHEQMCHVGMDICRRHLLDHAVLSRALRTFWLLFLTHKNALLKEFAVLLMDVLKSAIGDDASLYNADEQRWLIDALLCVQFALLNTFGNDDGGTANELQQQILTSVHSPSSVLLASLPLRMRAVETRNVLLAEPDAAVGAERLNQFFVDFMALSDAVDSIDAEAMANLLDVHRRPTCPERCNYRRTLFWRQRLFCQFVPIFVQFARTSTCSSVKRQVLLQLLGPLLQIVDHRLSVDSVLNELVQLHPVIVDALVDALMPQDDGTVSAVFAGTEQSSSLLDVLRTSLQRMPPAAGSTEMAQQVPRLVHALTANIARQTLLVQSKALECLRLLALPRLGIPPEVLRPLHVCMLRTGVLLAGSRKRLIRQRMALARNAWDLALA